MRLEYQNSEDDMVSATRMMMHKRKSVLFLQAIGAVLLFCAAVPRILAGPELDPTHLAAFTVASIFLAYPYLIARGARKQYRTIASQREPFSIEVEEAGVHLKSPTVDARIAWSAYSGYAENAHVFALLHQGGRVGTAISKSSFTQAQIDELRTILSTHLPRK